MVIIPNVPKLMHKFSRVSSLIDRTDYPSIHITSGPSDSSLVLYTAFHLTADGPNKNRICPTSCRIYWNDSLNLFTIEQIPSILTSPIVSISRKRRWHVRHSRSSSPSQRGIFYELDSPPGLTTSGNPVKYW